MPFFVVVKEVARVWLFSPCQHFRSVVCLSCLNWAKTSNYTSKVWIIDKVAEAEELSTMFSGSTQHTLQYYMSQF